MLDANVLLLKKRDEVPEGTLLCTYWTMPSNNEYGHRWWLRLHPLPWRLGINSADTN